MVKLLLQLNNTQGSIMKYSLSYLSQSGEEKEASIVDISEMNGESAFIMGLMVGSRNPELSGQVVNDRHLTALFFAVMEAEADVDHDVFTKLSLLLANNAREYATNLAAYLEEIHPKPEVNEDRPLAAPDDSGMEDDLISPAVNSSGSVNE
jgi:hypothetical protein